MITIIDSAFGNMEYKHRWIKKETITFFEKKCEVTIAAKAYNEKPITDEQRKSYKKFKFEISELSEKAKSEVISYISKNENKIILNDIELNNIIKLKTVLFIQDGTTILLCESSLDEENGIGIQLYPCLQVGPQDLFL